MLPSNIVLLGASYKFQQAAVLDLVSSIMRKKMVSFCGGGGAWTLPGCCLRCCSQPILNRYISCLRYVEFREMILLKYVFTKAGLCLINC